MANDMDSIARRYLSLMKRRRVVCGFNEKNGEAIVTTGEPREYKPGVTTYVNQREIPYDDYMYQKAQKGYSHRR